MECIDITSVVLQTLCVTVDGDLVVNGSETTDGGVIGVFRSRTPDGHPINTRVCVSSG